MVLHILHTNDIHSHFNSWQETLAYIKGEKAKWEAVGDTVLVLDLGDFLDRSHPLTDASLGGYSRKRLEEAGYDYVTIGNNEGIGLPKSAFNQLYRDLKLTALISNVFDLETGLRPAHTKPWAKITVEGKSIGLLALTAPLIFSYFPNGWDVREADAVLPDLFEALGECDYYLLLSHLGKPVDERLAQAYPFDVILGAHSHHILPQGELVDNCLLTGGGKYGQYIGHLTWNLETNQRAEVLIPLDTSDKPEALAAIQAGYDALEKIEVCQKRPPLSFMDICLEAIASYAQRDVTFMNSGLLLGELPSQRITMKDLHQLLPHGIHIIQAEMRGEDLKKLVLEEFEPVRESFKNKKISGMGSRGKIFGEIFYKNLQIKAGSLYIHNKEVDDNQVYSFATVDHLQYLPFFKTLEEKGHTKALFPELLREVVPIYLKETTR